MIEGSSDKYREDPHKDKPPHERLECYRQDAIRKIKGSPEDIEALKDFSLEQIQALVKVQEAMAGYDKRKAYQGYNHETDRRIIASELMAENNPLREMIVALEILLQQKTMRVRHLEEKIAEMRSGLKIGNKYNHPKDPNDGQ